MDRSLRIYMVRGERVMLDRDLAQLYGVPTKSLNLAVRRNSFRFPSDFMFRLTPHELDSLRFQSETLKRGQHSKYPPRAFTELGIAMLSSILKSPQAVLVNIAIMRVFQRLRRVISMDRALADKVDEHERHLSRHDQDIDSLMKVVPQLPGPPPSSKPVIGFRPPKGRPRRTED